MTQTPEQLSDPALTARLAVELQRTWSEGKPFERGGGVSFESYGAALVPEVKAIMAQALEEAAEDIDANTTHRCDNAEIPRERAAALRARTGEDR